MKKEYLPIGSVVLVKKSKKKLMVVGYHVKATDSNVCFDYMGCLFPEGIMSDTENYLFNDNQVTEVVFRGLEDKEEKAFSKKMSTALKNSSKTGKVEDIISIPLNLYNEFGKAKNDIISIPAAEYYAATHNTISIPLNLYKEACGKENNASSVIAIDAKLYRNYNNKAKNDSGASFISIPYDEYMKSSKKNNKNVISIPLQVYRDALGKQVISIPLEEYNRMVNSRNVITINAKEYEEYKNKEADDRVIKIPLNVYEKLSRNEKKEDIISIPLNVYERILNEEESAVISIPLSEYKRLTKAVEENGIIKLPVEVYNEILKKEKSDIDDKKNEVIEIPYDLYTKINVEN